MKTCLVHPERPAHAHGMCRKCYDGRRRGDAWVGMHAMPAPTDALQDIKDMAKLTRPAVLDDLQSYIHPAPFEVT